VRSSIKRLGVMEGDKLVGTGGEVVDSPGRRIKEAAFRVCVHSHCFTNGKQAAEYGASARTRDRERKRWGKERNS